MTSSRSSTAATTSTTTNQISRNLNLQDTEGVTVGEAGGDVTITSTDYGSVEAATDLSRDALLLGQAAIESNAGVVTAGLDNATRQLGTALDYNNLTVNRGFDFGDNALDAVAETTNGVFDFARDALGAQAKLVDQNVGAISGLAKQVSQSATQSTNEGVTRVAMIAFAALAAIFILPKLFGKGAQ